MNNYFKCSAFLDKLIINFNMKNIYLSTILSIIFIGVAFGQTDTASIDEIEVTDLLRFDTHSYDLGEVKKGDVVKFDIEFKNISSETVFIDFISTCDCTVVDFPQQEISPGMVGTLNVVFDSKDKVESETTDIDVFLTNKDSDNGSQIYYTLEYSFNLIK